MRQRESQGFPCGSDGKESAWNAGDLGSIPGSGRPLEKEMTTHYSILAWRLSWRSLEGYSPWGSQRVGRNWVTNTFIIHFSKEKSCLCFPFLHLGASFLHVCSKVSALFVTEEAISSLHFFACHLCLKSVSHTWVGLLLDSLFHFIDCMSKLSVASHCLWLS